MEQTNQISKQYGSLQVEIFATPAGLGEHAAARFAAIIRDVIAQKDSANVILATGNSMLPFLSALGRRTDIDWRRVRVFHMDEYLGMLDSHPASFRRYLRERIIDGVKPLAFYGIEGDAWDVTRECQRYDDLLHQYPADLCCLGIGENGHLAFNDPPVANFDDPFWVKVVALDEACRLQQVGEGHFPSVQQAPSHAITLTIPALLAAKKVLAIVPEKRKAKAVRQALTGEISIQCPSSILQTCAHTELFLDSDSASLL